MTTPFGLTLMRPYPDTEVDTPLPVITIDPATQAGLWLGAAGRPLSPEARHKKSQTNKETNPKTSLDGNRDQGKDQESDQD